jgi:hypothetical protein
LRSVVFEYGTIYKKWQQSAIPIFFDMGRYPIGWHQEAAKMEHLFLI